MYVLYYSCLFAYNRKDTTNFTGCKGLKVACLRALWGMDGRCGKSVVSIIGEKWVLRLGMWEGVGISERKCGNARDCVGLDCFFVVFGEMVTVIWCYIVYLLDKYS